MPACRCLLPVVRQCSSSEGNVACWYVPSRLPRRESPMRAEDGAGFFREIVVGKGAVGLVSTEGVAGGVGAGVGTGAT